LIYPSQQPREVGKGGRGKKNRKGEEHHNLKKNTLNGAVDKEGDPGNGRG